MVEQLTGLMGNLKVELIDPVVVKGLPQDEDYTKIDTLADQIQAKHQELGIA